METVVKHTQLLNVDFCCCNIVLSTTWVYDLILNKNILTE